MDEPNISSIRDSVEELSASALYELDGELAPAFEPTESLPAERVEPAQTAYSEHAGDDPTIKRAPDWPIAMDEHEPDDETRTRRRPSSLPPPSRAPFQSAPVVERPFNRAPWLTAPKLPPPPRVPGFGGALPNRASYPPAQVVRRPLPRPSPPPPRMPSTPPVRMFPVSGRDFGDATREQPMPRPRQLTLRSMRPKAPEPPPALDSQPSWHDDSSTTRTSLLPLTRSVGVVGREIRKRPLPFVAGAAVGLAMFLITLLLVDVSGGGAAAARGNPELLVTVGGPRSTALAESNVFVDGVLRCSAAPCRVDALAAGLHFVTVSAEGHATSAARVVRVTDNEPALLHVELDPVPEARPTAVEPVAPPVVTPVPTVAPAPTAVELPMATQSMPELGARLPAPAPAPAPLPAMTTLSLNSIPIANVVLDGRPLGSTPKLGVSVTPGNHVVVFVHAELGRRVQSVNVPAGGRQTVAVRF
jgi:hypothetical protein